MSETGLRLHQKPLAVLSLKGGETTAALTGIRDDAQSDPAYLFTVTAQPLERRAAGSSARVLKRSIVVVGVSFFITHTSYEFVSAGGSSSAASCKSLCLPLEIGKLPGARTRFTEKSDPNNLASVG